MQLVKPPPEEEWVARIEENGLLPEVEPGTIDVFRSAMASLGLIVPQSPSVNAAMFARAMPSTR